MTKMQPSEVILLVGTDPLQRSTVAEYLRDCGYVIMEASDAQEALAILRQQHVDVLVTDIELRGKSGFELSSAVRELRPYLKILLTRSPERTATIASDLCEDGPLDRPYHPQQLVERLKRISAAKGTNS
ncbi:response regulator receiver domain-containing protein [Rhizobium sp. ERR 1071]|uniref:response regulator n=1 Tax=Rhizobium sp. ERR 1071 TaxID=2572677 RepID=UPI0011990CCE|nr:response regulator [Rhizobium sp. ERR1071]TWB08233.1 response regulator receiver domain-containing protein [Rhizobium sp. ERR1071]